MPPINTEFIEELFNIAESFANAVIKTAPDVIEFEEKVTNLLDEATPEKQSNLLFLCGMLLIQIGKVKTMEKRTAVATSLVIKDILDTHISKITPNGDLIKTLTFALVYPVLNKDARNAIISPDCNC